MKYDVIVIGGGLGGLMAGITAAKRGKKTLLLEKHVTVGGLAAGFTRKGYYFDAGMSRCMGASIRPYLKEIGILQQADLRPQRAIWNIEGLWIDYDRLDCFFDGLAERFPEEKEALRAFYTRAVRPKEKLLALIFADTNAMPALQKQLHMLRLLVTMPVIVKGMSSAAMERDVLAEYLDRNGRAFAFLAEKEGEVDYRGEMSFVTKVGKWYSQMFNVYPAAGFQGLADAMAAVLTGHGGEVRTSTPVSQVLIENGRAVGVEVQSHGASETLYADSIICCTDLHKAIYQLIGPQHVDADFVANLDKSRLSYAIPLLFLGVNVPPHRIRECFQGREEVMYYPAIKPSQGEAFFSDHPLVVHSSCLHNPAHAPAGKSNLQVYLSCPPADWMDHWHPGRQADGEVQAGQGNGHRPRPGRTGEPHPRIARPLRAESLRTGHAFHHRAVYGQHRWFWSRLPHGRGLHPSEGVRQVPGALPGDREPLFCGPTGRLPRRRGHCPGVRQARGGAGLMAGEAG
jgi:phytoene dehydrogenase-like protein